MMGTDSKNAVPVGAPILGRRTSPGV